MAVENLKYQVVPHFYMEPVPDPVRTRTEGRPIFRDEEFVQVRIAGDRFFAPVFPAHAMWCRADRETAEDLGVEPGEEVTYAERWAEQYARFKENNVQLAEGTPLEMIGLSMSRIAELKACRVYSVEALAGLEYKALRSIGPSGQADKAKAQSFLDRSANFNMAAADARENEELKAQLDTMKKQILELQAAGAQELPPDPVPKPPPPPPSDDEMEDLLREDPVEEEPPEEDPYSDLTDDDLKEAVTKKYGVAPKGKTSRKTLINMYEQEIASV